jgi:tetratricopeptide (TPR) repeat protein
MLYALMVSRTSYAWIQRQAISDPHIQLRWFQVSRWVEDWPTVFPIVFRSDSEQSTVYRIAAPDRYPAVYETYLKARLALAQGRTDEGEKLLNTVLKQYPEFPAALNDRAVLLIERGERARAQRDLLKALQLRPHFELAKLNLARTIP